LLLLLLRLLLLLLRSDQMYQTFQSSQLTLGYCCRRVDSAVLLLVLLR
jgi:hypothetical protein